MRQNFESWLNNLSEWEGFRCEDSRDPGGRTVFGISEVYHPEAFAGGGEPTWEEAKAIYLRDYWIAGGCDALPFPLDVVHADGMVNPGPTAARSFLHLSGEHRDPLRRATEYIFLRLDYYADRVDKSPGKLVFLKGWMRRSTSMWKRTVGNIWSMESV